MRHSIKDKNITGQKFGKLTAIREIAVPDHIKNKTDKYWKVQCECGTIKTVNIYNLISGKIKSCGCWQKERTSEVNTTHGESHSKIYHTWVNMIGKCSNPRRGDYKYYGGRGIKVCKSWEKFVSFRDWAISEGYQDNLSVDRVNGNKGFMPSNCILAPISRGGGLIRNVRNIGGSKLTERDVYIIKKLYRLTNNSEHEEVQGYIAEAYGTNIKNIMDIIEGKTWEHVNIDNDK